jgi:hypothetical protein
MEKQTMRGAKIATSICGGNVKKCIKNKNIC